MPGDKTELLSEVGARCRLATLGLALRRRWLDPIEGRGARLAGCLAALGYEARVQRTVLAAARWEGDRGAFESCVFEGRRVTAVRLDESGSRISRGDDDRDAARRQLREVAINARHVQSATPDRREVALPTVAYGVDERRVHLRERERERERRGETQGGGVNVST